MLQGIPWYVYAVFIPTTLLSAWIFYMAARRSHWVLIILSGWLLLQAMLSFNGFYQDSSGLPPRQMLLIGPPTILILSLFLLPAGRRFLDELDLAAMTLLHIVRIPIELVLFWLFTNHAIPQLLTFEGRNFDILSGISAPFIFYFGLVRHKISRTGMLTWNFICLALLLNVVIHGFLSAPTAIQQFSFDQPNKGMMFFPFAWLPSVIVPLVLLSHMATIRMYIRK